MEAATPLRQAHVRTIGDRLVVDGLVVEDECAVRLVREREQNGDDPARIVRDAVEIGARVLDREQAGANAEFVKTEFEKASKDMQVEFADRARTIAEFFEKQFTAVFGEDDGQLAKELERRFGDGSSVSVQNRVREAVAETLSTSIAIYGVAGREFRHGSMPQFMIGTNLASGVMTTEQLRKLVANYVGTP